MDKNTSVFDAIFSKKLPVVSSLYAVSAVFFLFAILSATIWGGQNQVLIIVMGALTLAFAVAKHIWQRKNVSTESVVAQ